MLSEFGRRPMMGGKEGSFGDDMEKEIGLLLREQRRQDDDDDDVVERELNTYRSGSAPPTVEGSLYAAGGLFGAETAFSAFSGMKIENEYSSEEELRSDPAYHSYYYSNVNLNPRLPPPLLSKEDWKFAQRLKGRNSVVGGIGDRRKVNGSENGGAKSLFSMPPGFNSRKQAGEVEAEKVNNAPEWGGDGLAGFSGIGLGSRQKSLAEIFQDDLGLATPVAGNPSRPASRNAFDAKPENLGAAEAELAHLRRELASKDPLQSSAKDQVSSMVQSGGKPSSFTYAAAAGGSLSRSNTPDHLHVTRAPSPCLTPIGAGRVKTSEKRGMNSPSTVGGVSSDPNQHADLVSTLSAMNLSTNDVMEGDYHLSSHVDQDVENLQNHLFSFQDSQNPVKHNAFLKKSESGHLYMPSSKNNGPREELKNPSLLADRQTELQKIAFAPNNSYLKGSPTSINNGAGASPGQFLHTGSTNSSFPSYGLTGYSLSPALASMMGSQIGTGNLAPMYENVGAASPMGVPGKNIAAGASESYNLNRVGSQIAGNPLQAPFVDPMYLQYLRTSEYAAQVAAFSDPSLDRSFLANSYLVELQKAYNADLLSPQKSQYGVALGSKSSSPNHHGYYGSPAYGMPCPGSPQASHVFPNSPVGPRSPIRHGDLNIRFPSGMRNLPGGAMGARNLDAGSNMGGSYASSMLEEFKSNKTRRFELSEIAGHVVEFSADQYGSRFIQQKLETATTEEKTVVYQEIMPQALALMTDVFGNYVVQKFFEHGLPAQRRELAGKLLGHVLTLSLQMYGCRVIQKAIEVVDLDQKIKMVGELEGHIMRCVRDQNGNHVIQKCIECVPEENIQFVVTTFFDHVVTLSQHPYGCRMIQRILEHCRNPETLKKVMDEILASVSMLAQDQYGNYVIQHVLEHGNPDERSFIIEELAGKIVQMSQQKFASNVVEKCLTFSSPNERESLVNEMLGSTDENEPLQAMMKDQFANYVVQKVLETCEDQQRELILSRIKVHLTALRKYTYGKHIVARVEKLVVAGERRAAAQSSHAALVASSVQQTKAF